MANKLNSKDSTNRQDIPKIEEKAISQVLTENYMPYAMSVIVSRAIPEIDGFKPSHRKLLYTMYKMGLLKGNRTKSANIVGQTMKLNPHGDQAIYETMVRLTQSNEALLCPLIDAKGNFGKHYSRDMAYAASRYTEAKLMPICSEFFQELEKNAVEMIDNYDGTMKEPSLLPVPFPSILTNPTMGIAVSIASNICSFNLEEVCRATILRIKKPKANVLEVIKAPDFATGGTVVYDETELKKINETGRGTIRIRGKYRVDAQKRIIEIYEIPYSTTTENIIEDIVSLAKSGKEPSICAVRDETDLHGLKIAVEYKNGTDPEKLVQKLYKATKLEDTFSCNFNVLIDGVPEVRGITEIIDQWIRWRTDCVNKITKHELSQSQKKLERLQALEKLLLNINKAIKIIKDSQNDNDVILNLMSAFKINREQAEYIAEIKLKNLNKDYILNKTKEIQSLSNEISKLRDIVDNRKKLHSIIIKQLEEIIKKYSEPRRTDIIEEKDIPQESLVEQAVDDKVVRIIRTGRGYVQKSDILKATNTAKLLDNDNIVQTIDVANSGELLFFTSSCNVYKLKVSALDVSNGKNVGEFIPSFLDFEQGEGIISMIATSDFMGNAILSFEDGKMARIPLVAYETKQNRRKLVNAISAASPLVQCIAEIKPAVYVVETNLSRGVTVSSDLIPERTSKNTVGVQVVKLKKDEKVIRLVGAGGWPGKTPPKTSKIPAAPKRL